MTRPLQFASEFWPQSPTKGSYVLRTKHSQVVEIRLRGVFQSPPRTHYFRSRFPGGGGEGGNITVLTVLISSSMQPVIGSGVVFKLIMTPKMSVLVSVVIFEFKATCLCETAFGNRKQVVKRP